MENTEPKKDISLTEEEAKNLASMDKSNDPYSVFQEDIFEGEGKPYIYHHSNVNVMLDGHYYSLAYNSAGQVRDEKFQGIQREYHENGNIKEEITYKDGVVIGLVNHYDENGTLTESLPAEDQ